MSPSEKKLYAQYTENPTTFSTISTTNAEARRAAKINNFQQEKELKRKLEVVSPHPPQTISPTNIPAQYLSRNPSYLENDDHAVREVHLLHLTLNTHNTFQALESLNRELEVLSLRPPTPPSDPISLSRDYRERTRPSPNQPYSDRLDRPLSELLRSGTSGPILDKGGKPLRPFTLLDSRQRLQAGVFRSGHNLPTMTIDEYLEEERRRGGIIEGGGEASGVKAVPDEDDYEKGEVETMKAREWDEFVEANPKYVCLFLFAPFLF